MNYKKDILSYSSKKREEIAQFLMVWRQFLIDYSKRCLNEGAGICGEINFYYV